MRENGISLIYSFVGLSRICLVYHSSDECNKHSMYGGIRMEQSRIV